MTYPLASRIRYRDQPDHPAVGVIEGHTFNPASEEWEYLVRWRDRGVRTQTAHFIHTEFEVY